MPGTIVLTIGGQRVKVRWNGTAAPTPADVSDIENAWKKQRSAGAFAGAKAGGNVGAQEDSPSLFERGRRAAAKFPGPIGIAANTELAKAMGGVDYGKAAAEQIGESGKVASEASKVAGPTLKKARKFVGDVAGALVSPQENPAAGFSPRKAVSQGVQALDPSQMLDMASGAAGGQAGGKTAGSAGLVNGLMQYLASPMRPTLKFLTGIDDELIGKAQAGDRNAMEEMVGKILAFGATAVPAEKIVAAFKGKNAAANIEKLMTFAERKAGAIDMSGAAASKLDPHTGPAPKPTEPVPTPIDHQRPPTTIEEAMAGGTRRFTSTSDLLDAAARGEVEPNTVHDIGGQSVLFDYAPSGAPMIGTPVPGERLIHKAWREIAESQSDAVADDWLRKNGIDPAGVKANPNTTGTPPKTIEEAMAPPRPTEPVPTPVEQGGAGANPTVSEPPTAGPAAGGAEPGRTTAHADTDAVQVLAGWDPRQTNPETIAQWMEESKAHAGKEVAIADSIREKPRQAKPSEEAALGLRLNKLLEERKAAMDAGDAVAFDLADSEARKIADALAISGSEWGRQGVARQIVLKTDYTDFGLKRRAEKALDGKAAPKGLDERLAAMSQRIEDLEQKLREAIAKKESPMRPARGSVEDIRARRADALERLKANAGKAVAETLTAPVNIITGVGGAGSGGRYTAEAFQALVDLAGTYVDEGILAAKDLALKLKGHGLQGFTEKDFAQAAKEALGKKASQANRGRVAYGEDILAAGKWAVQDPEIAKMRFELDRAKWEADKALHRLEPKSVWHHVISVANLPRAMIGSIDLSAPGRQGWLGGMVNPSQWAKAWSAQMKAVKGPAEAHAAWSKIADDPDFSLFKRHGLEYNEPGGPLGSGEEMLRGNLLGQLDFRFNPYAAGERGFNEFLNTQRHGMMKTWVRWLKNWKGELTAGDLDGLANFANVLTGRGGASVPGFKNAAEFLSLGIWSPKLIASRMELLVGQPIFKRGMSKQGRLLIAGEYAKMLAMLATVSGIAYTAARNLFGKDNVVFGTDRHSSDFGKLIIRDPATNEWTRIDLGAGALQMLGFGNKAIDLKRTNAKGETKDLGNDYGESLEKEIGKFYRTKANPFIGAAWSLHTGKDPVGDPYGPKEAATGLLAPLSASELIAGWRKDGLSRADALGLLNWFGIGVNTYKTPPAR